MRKIAAFFMLFILVSCGSNESDDQVIIDQEDVVENLAPRMFALLEVVNNAENVDVNPIFSWEIAVDPESDLVTYQFILDTDPDPLTIIANELESTSFSGTQELSANTQYYWKVIAIDENGNTQESAISTFSTRALLLSVNQVVESASFSGRNGHTMVTFDNKLWIIAGSFQNDVWHSTDGIEWNLATSNAPFGRRSDHTSVVFDNKIWVIGGLVVQENNQLITTNDVWSSLNGVDWVLETDNAEFVSRRVHSSVVFDDKIWVINGFDDNEFFSLNDVWFSSNGSQWELATENSIENEGVVHQSLVFNNRIWLIGGSGSNSVWSSANGIDWEIAIENAAFTPRNISASAVYQNRMWIFGGEGPPIDNEIWHTSDGETWFMATQSPLSYSNRFQHKVTVFNDKVFLSAGASSPFTGNLNDVWEITLE